MYKEELTPKAKTRDCEMYLLFGNPSLHEDNDSKMMACLSMNLTWVNNWGFLTHLNVKAGHGGCWLEQSTAATAEWPGVL